ncbi:alpha/beta hydrolase [Filobacillus milosensis]|uniref:Alpha/beta hydrolase n=1 Tax=Filobacillus milosensis TaxID=94137 RepID=A0A4Y8II84_9BACI|nr:alpha/beta hydrolase [Filobacillus milosensis]TFB19518.1 alpha/beta hydrolase [Filobacillus milosensis]
MWKQRLVETSRGRFEFFTQGEGEPLCVTHLYSEFNEKGNHVADRFVSDFKVYLVNLKEAGNSSKVEEDIEMSMEESCKDLEAVREALGFEKWSFAGHSTGGMLGLVYAINHPDSLTRVMVGGATATKDYAYHEGSMYCQNSPLNARLKEIFAVINSPDSTPDERKEAGREWGKMSLYRPEKYFEYFNKPTSGKVVSKRLNFFSAYDFQHFDVREQLRDIRVPLVIYGGRHDAQCPYDFSEEIHECAPGSVLYTYEESNHNPFVEEQEKFHQMVKEFSRV